MATEIERGSIGTQDLEKGLIASPSARFFAIAINAMLVLLLFNAAALRNWAERKPSSQASVWLLEAAIGLEDLTKISPYEWGVRFRRGFAVGRPDFPE